MQQQQRTQEAVQQSSSGRKAAGMESKRYSCTLIRQLVAWPCHCRGCERVCSCSHPMNLPVTFAISQRADGPLVAAPAAPTAAGWHSCWCAFSTLPKSPAAADATTAAAAAALLAHLFVMSDVAAGPALPHHAGEVHIQRLLKDGVSANPSTPRQRLCTWRHSRSNTSQWGKRYVLNP
jgi:hypothetical protein